MASTTLINTISLPEFTDLVEKEFVITQQFVKPFAQQMYISDDMAANTGDQRRYDEVDTETFANIKPEGADAVKTAVGVGYSKTMVAYRLAKEVDITWEMRRYNKKPEIMSQLTSLKQFCPQRIDLDLTQRFTFATSTSYVNMDGDTVTTTTGDGLALVSTAHTLKFSSTTYRNQVVNNPVFSQGALEAAELLTVTNILNNFGQRRVMNFNTLFSSDDPTTCNEIKKVLRSTTDVDQNNPGVINTYKDKYTHVILPWLATTATGAYDSTKRRWWGIAATGQGILGWQAFFGMWEAPHMNPMPGDSNNGDDPHNDNWTFGTRASIGIVTLAGRGLIMSNPSS